MEVKGTYSPLFSKKRNIEGEIVFQEYECIVKKRVCSIKRILKNEKIIDELVNYYFLIEYYDNHRSIIKKVILEEVLFDTNNFMYIEEYKIIKYINIVVKDNKYELQELSKENKDTLLLNTTNNKKGDIELDSSQIVI